MDNTSLRVFVVEDDDYKYNRVQEVVLETVECTIERARSAIEGIKWLHENRCDVLVLDLSIPGRVDETASVDNGLQFLDDIQSAYSNCNVPSSIIGLSAYANTDNELRIRFERDGWILVQYDNASRDWAQPIKKTIARAYAQNRSFEIAACVIPLHGIRTLGSWQKTLADMAIFKGVYCQTDGWWYGRFSVFEFLISCLRYRKITWFRRQYTKLVTSSFFEKSGLDAPSVVAHSFGSYILGYSLLKFKDIKVDRVVLCGSILPQSFPWKSLIESGQVGAVFNIIGEQDNWPLICSYVVPGTGASGRFGFSDKHPRIREEFHFLKHSEFFDGRQMEIHWIPFLLQSNTDSANSQVNEVTGYPRGDHPILSWLLSTVAFWIFILILLGALFIFSVLYREGVGWLFQFGMQRIGVHHNQ